MYLLDSILHTHTHIDTSTPSLTLFPGVFLSLYLSNTLSFLSLTVKNAHMYIHAQPTTPPALHPLTHTYTHTLSLSHYEIYASLSLFYKESDDCAKIATLSDIHWTLSCMCM